MVFGRTKKYSARKKKFPSNSRTLSGLNKQLFNTEHFMFFTKAAVTII